VLDVAHNEQACELLVTRLQKLAQELNRENNAHNTLNTTRFHIVIGMLKDKNIEACLQHMRVLPAFWYCVDLPSARGEKAKRLANCLHHLHETQALSQTTNTDDKASAIIEVNSFESVNTAFDHAKRQAKLNDVILLVGSFILASEFSLLNKSNIEASS